MNSSGSRLASHESLGLEYLGIAFPPNHPSIHHVLLNTTDSHQLNLSLSRSSTNIPYAMNFQNPPAPLDEYSHDLRKSIGVDEDEILIIYPTRIDPNQNIRVALQLNIELGMKSKIVFPRYTLPEFMDYESFIKEYAKSIQAEPIFCPQLFSSRRYRNKSGEKVYTIYDLYKHADLVAFLPNADNFGYPILETMYLDMFSNILI